MALDIHSKSAFQIVVQFHDGCPSQQEQHFRLSSWNESLSDELTPIICELSVWVGSAEFEKHWLSWVMWAFKLWSNRARVQLVRPPSLSPLPSPLPFPFSGRPSRCQSCWILLWVDNVTLHNVFDLKLSGTFAGVENMKRDIDSTSHEWNSKPAWMFFAIWDIKPVQTVQCLYVSYTTAQSCDHSAKWLSIRSDSMYRKKKKILTQNSSLNEYILSELTFLVKLKTLEILQHEVQSVNKSLLNIQSTQRHWALIRKC